MNRRQFVRRSAITAVGLGFSSPLFSSAAFGAPRRRGTADKVVVTVNLDGGNDGLNTLVPLSQYDIYRRYRPTLGIARERLLPLHDAPDFALNPALAPLHALYQRGD